MKAFKTTEQGRLYQIHQNIYSFRHVSLNSTWTNTLIKWLITNLCNRFVHHRVKPLKVCLGWDYITWNSFVIVLTENYSTNWKL